MIGSKTCYRVAILLGLILAISGCWKGGNRYAGTKLPGLERIAVLPVDRASTRPASERPTCNISGESQYMSSYVTPEAAQRVTDILFSILAKDPRFKPVI